MSVRSLYHSLIIFTNVNNTYCMSLIFQQQEWVVVSRRSANVLTLMCTGMVTATWKHYRTSSRAALLSMMRFASNNVLCVLLLYVITVVQFMENCLQSIKKISFCQLHPKFHNNVNTLQKSSKIHVTVLYVTGTESIGTGLHQLLPDPVRVDSVPVCA